MREESVYIGKEFNSNRIALVYIGKEFNSNKIAQVHQHVFRFIVSEVKMPCSCYIKAKRFKAVFINKMIVLVLVLNKSTLSRIPYVPREQA